MALKCAYCSAQPATLVLAAARIGERAALARLRAAIEGSDARRCSRQVLDPPVGWVTCSPATGLIDEPVKMHQACCGAHLSMLLHTAERTPLPDMPGHGQQGPEFRLLKQPIRAHVKLLVAEEERLRKKGAVMRAARRFSWM
eukprot:356348-Chlamydomonas_euryale.AAC.4